MANSSRAATQHLPEGLSFQPIERLQVYVDNPKSIHSARFQELKDTLRADPSFLLQRRILVSDGPVHKMGGQVYGGNHRVEALRALYLEGWSTDLWPVGTAPVDVSDVDEKTFLERLYRDGNEWAEWETNGLSAQVQWLKSVGSDVSLLGFDQDEVAALLESTERMANDTAADRSERAAASAPAGNPTSGAGGADDEPESDPDDEDDDGVDHVGGAEDGPVVIGIRKLELLYPLEQFREVNDLLAWLAGHYGVETNAESAQRLLQEFADAHA